MVCGRAASSQTEEIVNLVLGRLIATQRTDIAALKAVGYSNR
jgi:hypothetical protein